MKKNLLIAVVSMLLATTLCAQNSHMYATTSAGGTSGGGTIIRMNPDGSGITVEFSYTCSMTSGCTPMEIGRAHV